MEWEPDEQDTWVADAQRWICQINGVLQCKIDRDAAGEISGVHVVAGMERDPRHIVRDVESLLKARLDIDVYYKKIGVVQVVDTDLQKGARSGQLAGLSPQTPATPVTRAPKKTRSDLAKETSGSMNAPDTTDRPGRAVPGSAVTFHPPHQKNPEVSEPQAPAVSPAADADPQLAAPIPAVLVVEDLGARVVCSGVGMMASDTSLRAEVQLRAGDVESNGVREGANHAESDLLLVAQATVDAVAELISDPVMLHLKEVRLENVGGQSVVLTAVDLVEGRQSTTLFGTCSTSHNRLQAVVYAVLDAVNRRLSLHGLKSLEAAD